MKNIGEAFSFPFRDPEWAVKFLLGAVFTLLSVILIGIPVLYGYFIELLQRVRRNERYPLPEWKDPGIKFILGLKYLITIFIYYLPIIILFIPLGFLFAVSAIHGEYFDEFVSSAFTMMIIFVAVIPFSIFVTLLTPIITIKFATKENITDGLNIGYVFNSFKQSWRDVLVVVLLSFSLEILSAIGILFFLVGILFTSFYASIVKFHLYGQIAESINQISQES